MKPVFEAMLAYRARGWVPILLHAAPEGVCTCRAGSDCDKPGKHARLTWGDGAMPDELQIRAYSQRFPLSSVGVNCGASNLFVVDLDGPGAIATWTGWLDEHGREPTLTSRTRRGYHLWFRQPDGEPLGNSAGTLAPGVDTRGAGGLVVAPPSVHASGHVYSWCPGATEPAACPSWLEDKARSASSNPLSEPHERPVRVAQGSPGRALAALVQVVMDGTEGTRNSRLYWAACRGVEHVLAGRMTWEQVAAPLTVAAETVGLPETEIFSTLRSASRRLGGGTA